MEAFCDQHPPGLFGQLYKSILNVQKEKPSQKCLEIQNSRVLSLLHNLSFFCNRVQVAYINIMCFVLMENSPFPVLIYSCTDLKSISHLTGNKNWQHQLQNIYNVQKKRLLSILPEIFQWKKTIRLKELVKQYFCLCSKKKLSHPEGK